MSTAEVMGALFDELAVGAELAAEPHVVTAADVHAFAEATGDHHPQHVDAAWAAGSRFGGPIAHGMLVLSLAVGRLPLDPERVVALRRVGDAVFKRPVHVGSTITVRGRIAQLRPLDDEVGRVVVALAVHDEHERLACRATAEVLWRRRPAFVPIPL
jgi:acyl dehydratase